jgi:hypothetical protein
VLRLRELAEATGKPTPQAKIAVSLKSAPDPKIKK